MTYARVLDRAADSTLTRGVSHSANRVRGHFNGHRRPLIRPFGHLLPKGEGPLLLVLEHPRAQTLQDRLGRIASDASQDHTHGVSLHGCYTHRSSRRLPTPAGARLLLRLRFAIHGQVSTICWRWCVGLWRAQRRSRMWAWRVRRRDAGGRTLGIAGVPSRWWSRASWSRWSSWAARADRARLPSPGCGSRRLFAMLHGHAMRRAASGRRSPPTPRARACHGSAARRGLGIPTSAAVAAANSSCAARGGRAAPACLDGHLEEASMIRRDHHRARTSRSMPAARPSGHRANTGDRPIRSAPTHFARPRRWQFDATRAGGHRLDFRPAPRALRAGQTRDVSLVRSPASAKLRFPPAGGEVVIWQSLGWFDIMREKGIMLVGAPLGPQGYLEWQGEAASDEKLRDGSTRRDGP